MKLILLTIFLFSPTIYAEYRAYQYIVKNKIISSQDQPNSHMVISTLNPVSYIAYHGGRSLINVDLLRTWMCPGFTGNSREICKSPYKELVNEGLE